MYAVAGLNQCLFIFVHEFCPAFEHIDNMEICSMGMPTSSCFGGTICSHKMGYHFTASGIGDAQITVDEEIT